MKISSENHLTQERNTVNNQQENIEDNLAAKVKMCSPYELQKQVDVSVVVTTCFQCLREPHKISQCELIMGGKAGLWV